MRPPRPAFRAPLLHLAVAMASAGAASAQAPSGTPDPLTLAATRSHYGAYAHSGVRSDTSMTYAHFGAELHCVNAPPAGGVSTFLYPLELPPLAGTLESVQVWAYDDEGGDLRVSVLRVCHGPVPPYAVRSVQAVREVAPEPDLGPVRLDIPLNLPPTSSPDCSILLEVRVARVGQACQGNAVTVMRVRMQMRDPNHIFRDGFLALERVPSAPDGPGASQ